MGNNLRKLWKLLFGRTTIFIVAILIQCFILLYGTYYLGTEILIFNNLMGVIAFVLILVLLNSPMNASFRTMWAILIIATPVIGVLLFTMSRLQPGTRRIRSVLDKLLLEQRDDLRPDRTAVNRILKTEEQDYGLFRYFYDIGSYPVYDNCEARYLPSGEAKFKELLHQLEKAQEFIFLEYFIIDKGVMWDSILEILQRKAKEGVEVRVMYDGTCTLSLLPLNYPKKLKKMGIKCQVFSPMIPFLATRQNNRDHRKILVIDGHTGFTGGINLADEYINVRERFGHWKDTSIMLKGKAVNTLTLLFLQMWNVKRGEMEDCEKYLYDYEQDRDRIRPNGGYIVPYGDQPYDDEDMGKKVYQNIIDKANDYVHIMTPYLILDDELQNSLIFAAQRGIDVKIIMPHIPDKKYAYYLARTYYPRLIEGGVKIYEYTPGFVHAKVFTSDDERAVVGTINLDYRSLFLHFECATFLLHNRVIFDIEDDFQNTLKKCQRITLDDCRNYNSILQLAGRVLRLIAPLM